MQFKFFLSATKFINFYSQSNQSLRLINSIPPVIGSILQLKFSTTLYLFRFVRISRIKENKRQNSTYSPSIELLVVCGPSDIFMLSLCIRSVFEFSHNPISKVVIVVRQQDLDEAKRQVEKIGILKDARILILSEDEIVPSNIRSLLLAKFENRYGWILQQLIKMKYTSESKSLGVLVMDADTVLLQPLEGIDENGNQHFSYSPEKNRSYIKFLRSVAIPIKRPFYSAVTHHMIIQPTIMRELLIEIGLEDLNQFTKRLVGFKSKTQNSPVSIDYEMYGQYLRSRYSQKINYRSFSNQSVTRSSKSILEVETILKRDKQSYFRSFSFHGYL